jgi:cytoskeletal protein CcmA (bactofilin family)
MGERRVWFRRRDRSHRTTSDAPESSPVERVRGAARTVIGAQTRVRGVLKGRGPVLVCGALRGEISVDGPLTVAPGATVHAEISVERAHVAGSVRGNLRAGSAVRLDGEGEIDGELSAPVVDLRPGAILRGRASVSGPERAPRR